MIKRTMTPDSTVTTADYLVRQATGARYEIAEIATEADGGPITRIYLGAPLDSSGDGLYAEQESITPATEDGQWHHDPSGETGAWEWLEAPAIV